jgi:NAD(P)-dependent dehydrogenase (short-subunit alcohol dehydrogenase family)
VNAVCPGVIHTPMVDRFVGGNMEAIKALVAGEPIGRIGEPSEIADAVVYLCSSRASFVTGLAMQVDGGWVAQ